MRHLRFLTPLAFLVALSACDDGDPPTDSGPPVGDAGPPVGDAGPEPDGGPIAAVCGDGAMDAGEACDDGNNDSGDGCSDACEVEAGFTCTGSPSACAPICGDGILAGMEACDDGGTAAGDGCSDACEVEAGYMCTGEPSACATVCGDGVIAGTEVCDDGNTDALDGCSDTCVVEAGVTCAGEPSVCTAVCGDGVVATIEECDDSNTAVDDGCSDTCTVERGFSCAGEPSVCMAGCGDGVVAAVETCDDGNMTDGDGCSMSCQSELGYSCTGEPSVCTTSCGDGVIVGAETCDDGNATAGDGCDASCATETGFRCTGEPSVCATACGDGVVVGGEGCDDGGITNGDGCDATCGIEFGWSCSGLGPSTCTLSETLADVALGGFGGCVLTATGRVGCFGDNTESEVGNGTDNVETFVPADTSIADATQITAGDEHHCALRAGGTVWCWGDNSNLQQGVAGTANDQPVPQQIAGLTGMRAVSAGGDHTCVLDSFGQIQCWGDGDNRQLGRSSTTDSETPIPVTLPAGRTATAVSAGGDHTCALLDDATVACWGDDDNGQLGDGSPGTDSETPTVAVGLTGVVQLDTGFNNTCARTMAGEVYCWGDNLDGQIGDGTTTDRSTPTLVTLPATAVDVSVGTDFVCALLSNDAIYCWGESTDYETGQASNLDQTTPQLVPGLTGRSFRDVEAGGRGACAVTTTNQRLCWGYGEEGQLGHQSGYQLDLSSPVAFVSAGAPTQLAISKSTYLGQLCAAFGTGDIECAGSGDTVSTSTVTGAVGVFPGFSSHLNQMTVIPGLVGTIQGALSGAFSCGRTSLGVACLGDNSAFQLGQGGTSTTDSAVPVPVTGLGVVDEIAVGGQFACVRVAGAVQCWGDNDNFQAGDGSTTDDQSTPVSLMGVTDATRIALGNNHGCLLRSGGGVSCWGDNGSGQLGTGTAGTDSATPLAVTGLPAGAATQIAVGSAHSCALVGSDVWCWGDNFYGQLAQGTTTDSATPVLAFSGATAIASGYNYMCAIETAGGVSCWGYGLDGQLGNGGETVTGMTSFTTPVSWPGLTGALEIVGGNSTTCVRRASGWACVGNRGAGQLGDGTTLDPMRPTLTVGL